VLGRVPANAPGITWSVTKTVNDRVGPYPVIARELTGDADNKYAPEINFDVQMVVVTPAWTRKPVPLMMMFGRPALPSAPVPEAVARFAALAGTDPAATLQLIAVRMGLLLPKIRGSNTWTSGFLPAAHQGVRLRSGPEPLFYLSNPPGITQEEQASVIGAVSKLNKIQSEKLADPETEARIAQYELAFRMQSSVPELMDTSKEPESVRQMYGAKAGEPSFANDCLLARRLVERGVRFVQVCARSNWDHHENIFGLLPRSCRDVDQASAALVQDLRQRGLLEDTLVIWGGEFGRTPVVQAINPAGKRGQPGRYHLKSAFTVWMAGTTDDLGFRPVENPVHVHDLHATALHLLGIDHKRLTWRHQGRNFRLTDVHGAVVRDILA